MTQIRLLLLTLLITPGLAFSDQSRYAHLNTFDELASRNAGRLFEQMEFE